LGTRLGRLWRRLTQQPTTKEEQKPKAPPVPSLPSDTFTAEATSIPETAKPAASPPSVPLIITPSATERQTKPKLTSLEQEERIKQNRALLDQTAKQIAKREGIPLDLMKMEMYLEGRLRKHILPKIDRLFAEVREGNNLLEQSHNIQNQRMDYLEKLVTDGKPAPLGDIGVPSFDEAHPEDLAEPQIGEPKEVIAPVVEKAPEIDPNDPIFGAAVLYLVGGD
jgi:hypothetical protein